MSNWSSVTNFEQLARDAGIDYRKRNDEELATVFDSFRPRRRVCLLVDLRVGDRIEHYAGDEISVDRFEHTFGRTVFNFRKIAGPAIGKKRTESLSATPSKNDQI